MRTDAERFDVELAMAPIEKGGGLLSVHELTFELIDLWYVGVTRGFLLAGTRFGGDNSVPYDPAKLEASLCTTADGSITPDCAG